MAFNTWLKQQTGLSLYDFRVLDLDETSEKQVQDLFNVWIEKCCPTPQFIATAIKTAADEGFKISIERNMDGKETI